MTNPAHVNSHYGNDDIYGRVLSALRAAGIDPAKATVEDLAGIDQFHGGRLPATQAMASGLGLTSGMTILDAGCGVGGPARYLAATYRCNVIGIDLSERFIEAARKLTDLVGLSDRVDCRVGDITSTGLPDASMDAAWSQNVFMNIPDKHAALAEIYRVLKPGGQFALQIIVVRKPGPVDMEYPVMWASSPEMNFLCTAGELDEMAQSVGFQLGPWQNEADLLVSPASAPIGDPRLIMNFEDFAAAVANYGRAREAGAVVPTATTLVKLNR